MDDDELDALLSTILDDLRNHGALDHDRGDVHRSGHIQDAGVRFQSENFRFLWVNRIDAAFEVVRDEIFHDTVADGKSIVGGAYDRDAAGSK